ncbi:DNA polymerase [Acidipropionibacterium acidipropionici]|uniref:DNA polymerase n=1 Tax=Acidipropionibacterium acidipropionici TaxID=1748 RepID=UPI0003FB5F56|nr:DNA polymerase [Acidipropionibacterium acidipropionici]ALN14341.1 hypothetical protein ASQ49_02620 [Acidipropionibacterium acidipropionici]APZ09896.1 hypothetical protein BWX38_12330 [Acidipropionibacterium acidipropionici]
MSTLYFDLETDSAAKLWTAGPGFVRIAGYAIDDGPVTITTDIAELIRLINEADLVVGHNVLAFDLAALWRYHGLDLDRLIAENRVFDTLIAERQYDPPRSSHADGHRYGLDACCARHGVAGKLKADGDTVLAALAKKYGGYDLIPLDDPVYRAYLATDVEATRALARVLPRDPYASREHRVLHRLGTISCVGVRVDVDLLERTLAEQATRLEASKRQMHDRYGLPLTGKKPQATTAGKQAIEAAIRDCGVEPPRTPKGSLATGKKALEKLVADHPDNQALAELCGVLTALNGERSMARTILDHVGPDGRIHPGISASQATGRISLTDPGLTVMGKRDRKNVLERAFILPDEGDVLVGADLSAADSRAMAILSQDAAYIDALQPGEDLHDAMAVSMFGDCGWDGTGHHPRRSEAKIVTHGTSYGMGAVRLAQDLGCTPDEAARHLAALDAAYPKLAAYKSAVRARGQYQILTSPFGRRLRVDPGMEWTQAPAFAGQGTARDLLMEGVLRLPDWMVGCIRATIHDEIILSVPEDRAEEARAELMRAFQFAYRGRPGDIPVPVIADLCDVGRDWADCYRSDHAEWPEVARDHRQQADCDDPDCTWHIHTTTERNAA